MIYLPEALRESYVTRIHSLPIHGHQGVAKTLERVSRDYYFLGLKKIVKRILTQYYVYRTLKVERHVLYGKL